MPPTSPPARWALTPPFHPCRRLRVAPRPPAVCSLWRFPSGCPGRALPAAISPWSPDFPRPCGRGRPAVRARPRRREHTDRTGDSRPRRRRPADLHNFRNILRRCCNPELITIYGVQPRRKSRQWPDVEITPPRSGSFAPAKSGASVSAHRNPLNPTSSHATKITRKRAAVRTRALKTRTRNRQVSYRLPSLPERTRLDAHRNEQRKTTGAAGRGPEGPAAGRALRQHGPPFQFRDGQGQE